MKPPQDVGVSRFCSSKAFYVIGLGKQPFRRRNLTDKVRIPFSICSSWFYVSSNTKMCITKSDKSVKKEGSFNLVFARFIFFVMLERKDNPTGL